jgi:membrane-bound lytic murein transglycosylase D
MESIEKVIAWKLDDIKSLNPVYKTTYIPATEPKQCITGPLDKIGLLVTSEDSLYAVEDRNFGAAYLAQLALQAQQKRNQDQLVTSQPNLPINKPKSTVITTIKYTYHKVKAGENLSRIAAQYNVTIQNIMEWNNLPNTQITVGALLKIQTLVTTTVETASSDEKPIVISTDTIQKPAPVQQRPAPVRKKYYTVRSGDGFSRIASNHGLTQNQLEELNPGVNPSRIRPGQRLRIK